MPDPLIPNHGESEPKDPSPAPEQREKEQAKEGVGQWVQRQFLKHALPWMPGGMMAFPDMVEGGEENIPPKAYEKFLGGKKLTTKQQKDLEAAFLSNPAFDREREVRKVLSAIGIPNRADVAKKMRVEGIYSEGPEAQAPAPVAAPGWPPILPSDERLREVLAGDKGLSVATFRHTVLALKRDTAKGTTWDAKTLLAYVAHPDRKKELAKFEHHIRDAAHAGELLLKLTPLLSETSIKGPLHPEKRPPGLPAFREDFAYEKVDAFAKATERFSKARDQRSEIKAIEDTLNALRDLAPTFELPAYLDLFKKPITVVDAIVIREFHAMVQCVNDGLLIPQGMLLQGKGHIAHIPDWAECKTVNPVPGVAVNTYVAPIPQNADAENSFAVGSWTFENKAHSRDRGSEAQQYILAAPDGLPYISELKAILRMQGREKILEDIDERNVSREELVHTLWNTQEMQSRLADSKVRSIDIPGLILRPQAFAEYTTIARPIAVGLSKSSPQDGPEIVLPILMYESVGESYAQFAGFLHIMETATDPLEINAAFFYFLAGVELHGHTVGAWHRRAQAGSPLYLNSEQAGQLDHQLFSLLILEKIRKHPSNAELRKTGPEAAKEQVKVLRGLFNELFYDAKEVLGDPVKHIDRVRKEQVEWEEKNAFKPLHPEKIPEELKKGMLNVPEAKLLALQTEMEGVFLQLASHAKRFDLKSFCKVFNAIVPADKIPAQFQELVGTEGTGDTILVDNFTEWVNKFVLMPNGRFFYFNPEYRAHGTVPDWEKCHKPIKNWDITVIHCSMEVHDAKGNSKPMHGFAKENLAFVDKAASDAEAIEMFEAHRSSTTKDSHVTAVRTALKSGKVSLEDFQKFNLLLREYEECEHCMSQSVGGMRDYIVWKGRSILYRDECTTAIRSAIATLAKVNAEDINAMYLNATAEETRAGLCSYIRAMDQYYQVGDYEKANFAYEAFITDSMVKLGQLYHALRTLSPDSTAYLNSMTHRAGFSVLLTALRDVAKDAGVDEASHAAVDKATAEKKLLALRNLHNRFFRDADAVRTTESRTLNPEAMPKEFAERRQDISREKINGVSKNLNDSIALLPGYLYRGEPKEGILGKINAVRIEAMKLAPNLKFPNHIDPLFSGKNITSDLFDSFLTALNNQFFLPRGFVHIGDERVHIDDWKNVKSLSTPFGTMYVIEVDGVITGKHGVAAGNIILLNTNATRAHVTENWNGMRKGRRAVGPADQTLQDFVQNNLITETLWQNANFLFVHGEEVAHAKVHMLRERAIVRGNTIPRCIRASFDITDILQKILPAEVLAEPTTLRIFTGRAAEETRANVFAPITAMKTALADNNAQLANTIWLDFISETEDRSVALKLSSLDAEGLLYNAGAQILLRSLYERIRASTIRKLTPETFDDKTEAEKRVQILEATYQEFFVLPEEALVLMTAQGIASGTATTIELQEQLSQMRKDPLLSKTSLARLEAVGEVGKVLAAETKKPTGERDFEEVLKTIRKKLSDKVDEKEVFTGAEIEQMVREGMFGEEIVRVAAEERTALEGLVQEDMGKAMERLRVDPNVIYQLGNAGVLGKIAAALEVKVSDGTNVGTMQEEITNAIKGKK